MRSMSAADIDVTSPTVDRGNVSVMPSMVDDIIQQ